MTENEGLTSSDDDEATAVVSARGACALVTAACPRSYPRALEDRQKQHTMIPADFSSEDFLKKFRKVFGANTTVRLEKAGCYDEPHKRFRPSADRRERHKHIALKASGPFAHKKIADAFQREAGVRIHFSFKQQRFGGYIRYLMEPGKKASTDLDQNPAVYPAALNIKKEMDQAPHPGEEGRGKEAKAGKKRKGLTFDEVSNIVIEGVGEGELRTGRQLASAAAKLKREGNAELWNYLGGVKGPREIRAVVGKIWWMLGREGNTMWHSHAAHPLGSFTYDSLPQVKEWLRERGQKFVLILSGDGGLGKTQLAMALMSELCPRGFWFLDDPDDFREIEGEIEADHGIIVDEVELSKFHPNQVKKLFDLEVSRRIRCRNMNGSIPANTPRIFITNSNRSEFFPEMSPRDFTGVNRRCKFVNVTSDLRRRQATAARAAPVPAAAAAPVGDGSVPQGVVSAVTAALTEAQLGHKVAEALAWCDEMGAARVAEVAEHASDLARALQLKALQVDRCVAALRALEAEVREEDDVVLPVEMQGPEDEEDVWGHGGSLDDE